MPIRQHATPHIARLHACMRRMARIITCPGLRVSACSKAQASCAGEIPAPGKAVSGGTTRTLGSMRLTRLRGTPSQNDSTDTRPASCSPPYRLVHLLQLMAQHRNQSLIGWTSPLSSSCHSPHSPRACSDVDASGMQHATLASSQRHPTPSILDEGISCHRWTSEV